METAFIGLGVLVAALQIAIVYLLTKRQIHLHTLHAASQDSAADRQLNMIALQVRYQYEWSMREAALDYSIARNDVIRDARIKLLQGFGDALKESRSIPYDEVLDKIEKDPKLDAHLTTMMSNFELMALAIHAKIADENVAFEMHAETAIQYVTAFSEYIEYRRKTDNPRQYEYLTRLAARWQVRLNDLGIKRQPFFADLRNRTDQINDESLALR